MIQKQENSQCDTVLNFAKIPHPLQYLNFGTLCINLLRIICYTLIQLIVKLMVGYQKQYIAYTKIPLCNCQRVPWMPVGNLWLKADQWPKKLQCTCTYTPDQ